MAGTEEQRGSEVAAKVIREHEPRPFGCSCGAQIGDDIDRRWHLVNAAVSATVDSIQQGLQKIWYGAL